MTELIAQYWPHYLAGMIAWSFFLGVNDDDLTIYRLVGTLLWPIALAYYIGTWIREVFL